MCFTALCLGRHHRPRRHLPDYLPDWDCFRKQKLQTLAPPVPSPEEIKLTDIENENNHDNNIIKVATTISERFIFLTFNLSACAHWSLKNGSVKVEKLMDVERYSHVMHISSMDVACSATQLAR